MREQRLTTYSSGRPTAPLNPNVRHHMATKSYHILYLNPEVADARWTHLHRFIHPSSAQDPGWKSMLCTELDMNHGVFLSCKAKNWSGEGPKTILLKYGLVDSIVEVVSHANQLGFVGPDGFPDIQPERQNP
jgi:hypothetical protein